MSKRKPKRSLYAGVALMSVLAMLLSGCLTVTVTNVSKDQTARVYVFFPDRKGYTSASLAPGASDSDFSDGSGYYLIRVGGNEDHQRNMKELRETYTKVLTTPGLTPAQVQAVTKKIALLREQEAKAQQSYARCEGSVENGSVTVTVDWDAAKKDWTLQCVEKEDKTESK
jgi:hypothetical protein